jgi:hypothetical protein
MVLNLLALGYFAVPPSSKLQKMPLGTRARKLQGRVEPAKVISFGDGLIYSKLLRFLPQIVKNK